MSDDTRMPAEPIWPEIETRRPPPGFVSAEEDMLHDIEETDRLEAGLLTPRKADSIRLVATLHAENGKEVNVDSLARLYGVADRSEVARLLEELGASETNGPASG